MTPELLSHELRQGSGNYLEQRRRTVGLSLAAAASMGLIVLYQTGIIKHLPEPPLPGFNADKVDAAPEAYKTLSMPDAALGLGSYATTLALAAMGGADRARKQPWIPLALTAKVAIDVSQASRLTLNQWTKQKAFCFWCLTASAATFATVPFVLSEAREAFRQLRNRLAS